MDGPFTGSQGANAPEGAAALRESSAARCFELPDHLTEETFFLREQLYEAIERALRHMNRREPRQVEEIMDAVRAHYPVPARLLESCLYCSRENDIGALQCQYFGLIPELARRSARRYYGKGPIINRLSLAAELLKKQYAGLHEERFALMLLNYRGSLLDVITVQNGTFDSTPFLLSHMISIVARSKARAFVMCHNHPRGTLRPSKEDLICTARAMSAAGSIGVPLLDHIIIAGDKAVSIREAGHFAEDLWLRQMPNYPLLRDWIDRSLIDEL